MKQAGPVRVEECGVAMRDGVALATDVIRPDDDDAHPVLLVRTPYGRAGVRQYDDPVRWARRGWAVVVQDARGRFDSGGEFVPFHQEPADGYDTIEWCATRPWSDGNVVMTGLSYIGATQWLAASTRHPALKAISPGVTAASYQDDWFYEGGAFQLGFPTSWATMLVAGATDSRKRAARRALTFADDWLRLLRSPDQQRKLAEMFPYYAKWRERDAADYWRPIDVTREFRRLDLPAFHIAGWYDVFCEASLAAYTGMAERAATPRARRGQRLVVGPWTHASVYESMGAELDWGIRANGLIQGVPDQIHDFLRAAVDGSEVPGGVSVFVMGSNTWRDLESWPPVAATTTLYLDDGGRGAMRGGRLVSEPPAAAGRCGYRHDPADPVPTRGGRTLNPVLPPAGSLDQRAIEDRDDVLVYTSDPLPADVTVIGTITARVGFTSTAPQADVVVKLCDVHPDGRSMNVVDGVRRVELTPGRRRGVDVRVGSTAMTFARGHRIRVHIASSNFPRFDVLEAADQVVHTGGRRPSAVMLPVVR